MTTDFEELHAPTREQMHTYIQTGRKAIEFALLGAVIRAQSITQDQDEAELAELYGLLDLYDRHMARYTSNVSNSDSDSNVQGSLL
jgi:hypothetical protein